MITVFLLDDHALVRTGYKLILQQHLDIQVVGEAETTRASGSIFLMMS